MNSLSPYSVHLSNNRIIKLSNSVPLNFKSNFSANSFNNNNNNNLINFFKLTDGVSSTSSDSLNYAMNNSNSDNNNNKNEKETSIFLKIPDEYILDLFNTYGEQDSICNYLILEKNININMNLNDKELGKIFLSEYLDIFKNINITNLSIPFIEEKGNIISNSFNPTLSSMILLINTKQKLNIKYNKKVSKDNFSIKMFSDSQIYIEFDENNPPYSREIITKKINLIDKIIGKHKINLNEINNEKSFISLLWTPTDTCKINSSFLAYYSFNFKLIGIFIIKRNDYKWFTTFYINNGNIKDFKSDYLNQVENMENFIKNCICTNEDNHLKKKYYSHDYKRYIYNS